MAGISKAGTTASIPSGAMTPAQALAALQAALSPQEETPEPGFMTRKQWSEAWNLSDSHTYRLLADGVAAGKVESKHFRIKTGSVTRPTIHYRVVV
jgi:hypothetical protein